jgi:aspartyl-tRNA(Asn)/glutamyl-tRNA(Gln) amidotransferase subunit B
MRKKEGNVDYKYFPEPNIFPIQLDPAWIKDIQDHLEEMPEARLARFKEQFGLNDYDASVLVADRELADFFEKVAAATTDYKKAANYVITDVIAWLNKNNAALASVEENAGELAALINLVNDGTISSKQAKEVFDEVMQGKKAAQVVEEKGMKQMSDEAGLLALINQVLDENPQSIEDFKNGKKRAMGFLVGQVMKASKGTANPKMTNQLLASELSKR